MNWWNSNNGQKWYWDNVVKPKHSSKHDEAKLDAARKKAKTAKERKRLDAIKKQRRRREEERARGAKKMQQKSKGWWK